MAKVINLRLARKTKRRKEQQREAEANRALHGEPGHIKAARKAEEKRTRLGLDRHMRDKD